MKQGWEQIGIFRRRVYTDTEQYMERQSAKLVSKEAWCRKVDHHNMLCLVAVLKKAAITTPGMSVLCLAARLGGEVKAFLAQGCFAIGVDVNPGDRSKTVLHGDFHALQFADSSIDLVYLNCLDHAQDPYQVFREIHRVLKPEGIFHFETEPGYMEKTPDGTEYKMSDAFDCLEWAYRDEVVGEIEKNGFTKVDAYHYPAAKAHPYGYILRRSNEGWMARH